MMDKFLTPTSTQLGEMFDTTNTTPNTTTNITPNTTTNTTPIELKSPKKEGNDEPTKSRKKPTRNSTVWDHFTKVKDGNPKDPR